MNPLTSALHRGRDLGAIHLWEPLHRLSLLARAHSRAGARHFAEGLQFRTAAEDWSADRKREWQLARLRQVARDAAATTPFWRERFRDVGFDPRADFSFEDWGRLPVLEREEIHAAGEALVSTAIPRASLVKDATGGSTGTPTTLWKGPEEMGWNHSGGEHFMRRIGLPAGSAIALLWGHHLDPVRRKSPRERLQDLVHNNRWYDCFRLSPEVLGGYHEDLQAWRPAGMIAYASALAALAETVESLVAAGGAPPRYPTRAFVTGAEKLYAHQRDRVRRVFGVPVHERYGSRDVGLMGFQVDPESLDFTIDWPRLVLEPETDDPLAGIIVTKLRADGMPMLRYRVGDIGRFPAGARVGHPTLLLHEVVGRDLDRLWLPDGRWLQGTSFPHLLKDFPIREYQVFQDASFAVEIRVVATDGFDDDARARIVDLISANLPGVAVSLRLVDEIPRTKANKWRPVVSEAAPRGAGAPPAAAGQERSS